MHSATAKERPIDILHLVDRPDTLIANATVIPLTDKILLDREEILDLIDQVRAAIPEDIQHAQEVLIARDSLIEDARNAAQRMQEEAEALFKQRLDQHELVVAARNEAKETVARGQQQSEALLHQAELEAAARRRELDEYSLELLRRLEANLNGQLANVRSGIEAISDGQDSGPGSAVPPYREESPD